MDLHYEIHGSRQGKPVILLHGGGADLREWKYLSPLLSRHYQVIALDARGCGQSPSQTEPADYVKDLLDLLNHLRIERAALIGHSIGGQLATEFALAYPERLQELILIAPALSGFVHSPDLVASLQSVQAVAPDVAAMTERVVTSPFCSVIKNSPHLELMKQLTEHNIKKMFEWTAFGAVWPKPPAIERLHELKPRTLSIRGSLDHEDMIRIENHFRAAPAIEFAEVAGGDHMVNITHPEEIYAHIVSFLGK